MIKVKIKNMLKKAMGMACPAATQDLELNTKNRDASIEAEHIQYGPLNLNDEEYWERAADHWNTDVETAKKSLCGNGGPIEEDKISYEWQEKSEK